MNTKRRQRLVLHHGLTPGWWLVLLLLFVGFNFWWGGLFDARVAKADDSLPLCEAGQEYDAGLCYPKCNDGFDGVGPVCWERCPDGYTDDGALCRKDAIIIAKASYGRGAGTPMTCSDTEELDGALCYPKCDNGFDGVGPVCWQVCPDGYTDDGAFCRKDAVIIAKESYGRGAGTLPAMSCNGNEELDGALCYPPCNAGYDGVGPVCWQICPSGYADDGLTCRRDAHIFAKHSYTTSSTSCQAGYTWVLFVCWQNCPSGYTDDGAFCRRDAHIFSKDSYGRGAGHVPSLQCAAGMEEDGGLCYPPCDAGYDGVGPVCWQVCPEGYADDGAFCRKDAIIIAKNTYGRGAGTPVHTCAAGQEADGGLCYNPCDAGYVGVGPVCWQQCPEGYADDGALCRKDAHIFAKNSYGRGVGTIPNCDINNLNCAGNFEVSNNFRPIPSGYHFDNWGKPNTQYDDSTDFDNATLIRMFGGVNVCQTGSTAQDCTLNAAARQWRAGWLKSLEGGHCYGMATTSQLFFAGLDQPGNYQSGAGTTYALDPATAVRRNISELAATQSLQPADGSGDGWLRSGKPSEMLSLIRDRLQNQPADPYVLAIYKQGGGGHAVTPFAIENRGNGVYWLHIYDNNWPDVDRYIVFDTTKETWLYGFGASNPAESSGAWRGDATTNSLALRPTSAHKLSGWKCPFCRQTVSASSVQATDKVEFTLIGEGRLLVIDAQQQAVGWDFNSDQFVNQIAGAERIEFLGGRGDAVNPTLRLPLQSGNAPYTVYASGDTLTQTVTADLMVIGPGFMVGVNGLVIAPQQNLRMTIRPDGSLIAFNASDTASFTPTLVLASDTDPSGHGLLFNVGGVQLSPSKSVTVTLDLTNHTLNFVDDDADADTYALELLRITPAGQEQTYQAADVSLNQATSGVMNFGAWDGSGAMNFTLGGESQTVDNEAAQGSRVFLPLVVK